MIRVLVVKHKTDTQWRVLWAGEGPCIDSAIAALVEAYGQDLDGCDASAVIKHFTVGLRCTFRILTLENKVQL